MAARRAEAVRPLAERLAGQGHEVINVDGGMQAWEAAGKPVVTDDGTPGRTV